MANEIVIEVKGASYRYEYAFEKITNPEVECYEVVDEKYFSSGVEVDEQVIPNYVFNAFELIREEIGVGENEQ